MFRRTCQTLLLAVVATFTLAASAQACPGCKEATSEASRQMARGYSYSILFMMPIPFIILGSFGGYVYYTVRQREYTDRKRDAESAAGQNGASSAQESDASRSQ